ncbi:MAG: hypothetical protein JXA71_16435, partial [Chitinispirillaceae bacterium]|nr:hypothetical protein [Chitinispirillaceae bacterium]
KGSAALVLSVLSALAYGGTSGELADTPGIDVSGRVIFEQGQMFNAHLNGNVIVNPQWLHRDFLRLRLQKNVTNRLSIKAEPELKLWFATYPSTIGTALAPFRQYFTLSMIEAQGTYNLFGNDHPLLSIAAGIFPVKYNPDAKNLGEYLFRAGAYPPYIFSSFDYPFSQLTGFRVSSEMAGFFRHDFLLHTETKVVPLHDWSLSYLANVDFRGVALTAGASLHHWISVNESKTTVNNDMISAFYDRNGVVRHYTFKGIKLLGRCSFDPKKLLPQKLVSLFDTADLRLYGESAILGIKNHIPYLRVINGADTTWILDTTKNYYTDLSQRMPIMVGLNFPTCRLLDYLSLEVEYYSWPFTNSLYNATFYEENPVPRNFSGTYSKIDYLYDTWKWSLQAKKSLINGFSLVGQVARDHTHHDIFFISERDEEEALTRVNSWYWMVRMLYSF